MHLNYYFKVVAFGILADFCLNTDTHSVQTKVPSCTQEGAGLCLLIAFINPHVVQLYVCPAVCCM